MLENWGVFRMVDSKSMKKELLNMLDNSDSTFDERVEKLKFSRFDGIPRIMMVRHGLDYDTACRMVVECLDLRRPYYMDFLRGNISKDEWFGRRKEIDMLVIARYTGMLN